MNVRSLIQPSKALSVELIGTYNGWWLLYVKKDEQLRKIYILMKCYVKYIVYKEFWKLNM